MKRVLLAVVLLFSAQVARAGPLGAEVQTWHYDSQKNFVTVRIVNTSQKEITAFNLSVEVTLASGVSQFQVTHDLLNIAVVLDRFKDTPDEPRLRARLGLGAIPVGGSYDEKITVLAGLKDFKAVLDVVAYADKTAESANPAALQRLIAARTAMANSIQKANELITSAIADSTDTSPHTTASSRVQNLFSAWKATPHYDVIDMNGGELTGIIRELNQVPSVKGDVSETEYLRSYIAAKAKEQATWRDQAQLTGGQK